MIVITLTDCPPKVRGDLSKWLFEINTGVYVGNISARVRDELWQRICENIGSGRATMVFNAKGEQKLDFRVHNTTWEPVDFDGLKLMRRPTDTHKNSETEIWGLGFSRASKMQTARRVENARRKKEATLPYVVVDIETTGLSIQSDRIIEVAAVLIENGEVAAEFSSLVKIEQKLPNQIVELTGITDENLKENGGELKNTLETLVGFIDRYKLVGHNIKFDYEFLSMECKRCGIRFPANQWIDTIKLARRKVMDVNDYSLSTLAEHMNIDTKGIHRALTDCHITYQLYKRLNEI